MEIIDSFNAFLATLSPIFVGFVCLFAGIFVYWLLSFLYRKSCEEEDNRKVNGELDEEEVYMENEEKKHAIIAERFDIVFDTNASNFNVALITDKKTKKEYLFFGDNCTESGGFTKLD